MILSNAFIDVNNNIQRGQSFDRVDWAALNIMTRVTKILSLLENITFATNIFINNKIFLHYVIFPC